MNRKLHIITAVYLCLILGVYPLFYQDFYFNITISKFLFFVLTTACYACLCLFLVGYKGKMEDIMLLFRLSAADFAMLFFLAANLIAFFAAEDKTEAFTGSNSRYQGLLLFLIYGILYFSLTRFYQHQDWYITVFAEASALVYGLGIFQHFGIDFLGFYHDLSAETRAKFLSTIGNINVYSEYCSMTLGLFGIYFCEKKRSGPARIGYGLLIVLGTMALICANSDSGIAGCLVFVLAAGIFYLFRNQRLVYYTACMTLAALGLSGIGFLQKRFSMRGTEFDGLAKAAEHPEAFLRIALILLILTVIVAILQKKGKLRMGVWITAAAGLFAFAAGIAALAGRPEIEAWFTFSDLWGTNRGFVWSRLWRMFCDFPIMRMLTGAGQGSVGIYMSRYFADEMKTLGVVYDSAHNEYLQYLFTIGAAGLAAYLSLIAVSLRDLLKKASPLSFALAGGVLVYCIQAVGNISQPIVSPFLFVLVAWGQAVCRENTIRRKKV